MLTRNQIRDFKEHLNARIVSGVEHDWLEKLTDHAEIALDALEAIWPFVAEDLGCSVSYEYALAIQKVGHALDKNVDIQSSGKHLFCVRTQ